MGKAKLVCGVTFISFPTSDESLYQKAVDFYQRRLGFTVVQEYDHSSMSVGVKSVASHCASSVRETWLNVLPDDAQQALESAAPGTTIKIRLTPDGPGSAEVEAKIDAVIDRYKDKDWRGASAAMVFHTDDLTDVKSDLGDYPTEYLSGVPSGQQAAEAYVLDPLGNLIGFTTRHNPFSSHDRPATLSGDAQSTSTGPQQTSSSVGTTGVATPALTSSVGGGSKKKKIAVMTSGGDAPGMNAVVRAVVRTAIARGCDAYAVYEGYQGLVTGGDYIKKTSWDEVRGYLALGGTKIGTARCKEFRERDGRLKACVNMIKAGIDGLIVCGGDGSLTGADRFREEWPSLVQEAKEKNLVTPQELAGHEHLYICGLVGSIDNDMSNTDATIGAYSSLDRICQAVDFIDATAESHSRAFVIEVMGRHCGWLGLMAGLATGADYIFIPERPPSKDEWRRKMSDVVLRHRKNGMRRTIVIVAEGAIDTDLNAITPVMVKDQLVDLGLDTRITTLGHVQRGGTAVAFDRMLATLQGVEAVDAILTSTPETPSPMIGLTENKVVRRDLIESVKLTGSVAEAINRKDFDGAMGLRDSEFCEHLDNFYMINSADKDKPLSPADKKLKVAIVCIGAPAGGMNAAIRAAACYCFARGHTPYAIHNGFTGLSRHESVRELNWLEVEQYGNQGGCEIGTNRHTPDVDLGMVAYYFQKYAFDGLVIIGGFEAFNSLHILSEARKSYPAFRIPMVCLPATISNNVPGTEYSLGTDTCLNALVQYCDVIKQSASSTRRRAFVVEVQGGNSGYVASYAGLVTGAHAVYTPEEGISLKQLSADIEFLKHQFAHDSGRNRAGRLILRNEKASKTFNTDVLVSILQNEGGSQFEAREAIPGHVQQGGTPSPMDRARAARFAVRCVQFIEDQQEVRSKPTPDQDSMYSVVGVRKAKLVYTPVRDLWDFETEVSSRRPNKIHWNRLITIADMLVGRTKV
uniref:ATP-dependent 6-phosphofructokinase n=1 Tax=Blastobotrys adeninivorans TaxID=409370 RepID=A0A060TAE5_BLAAD